MCGIAGAMRLDGGPVDAAHMVAMANAIAHRGPDDSGVWVDGSIGLGHRRLAIIDLSPAGGQPMLSRDRRFALSYNGELYNYLDLKPELEQAGWVFRSSSDTEVMLAALSLWGPKAVERFNGIFAFAFWNGHERTLLLGRDRYGTKPLYVARAGNTLLFGSEIKALLAHRAMRASIDLPALAEYLTFQNFLGERTLFRDVQMVPAGTLITYRPEPGAPETRHLYWDFAFQEGPGPYNQERVLEELSERFSEAVRRQLVGDVEIGSFLSGGVDTGLIAAHASKHRPHMKCFTVGFDTRTATGLEFSFDERPQAEHISYLLRTEHYEMVLKAGDMEACMGPIVRHIEEPRVGQSYPNFYAAKLARAFVKVVLCGTGGDELFAGYPWRYAAGPFDDFGRFIDSYYSSWQRMLSPQELSEVMAPVWGEARIAPRDIFASVFKDHHRQARRSEDFLNASLYFEGKTFLHGLLTVQDKLAMAHGLEIRVPFLDNDLVDFAMKLPMGLKLGQPAGERLDENDLPAKTELRSRVGKRILRELFGRHMPASISEAPKQGFSAPDNSWFRGESAEFVRRALLTPHTRLGQLLDTSALARLIEEHLTGGRNRRLLIWSLLNLEYGLREFFPDPAAS